MAGERGGRLWLPFTADGRRGAARAARRAAGPARAALRAAAAGRPRARARRARRSSRPSASRASGSTSTGTRTTGPRLPRAARRRGARPHAAGRPVPARAARALPAHASASRSRRTPREVLERLRAEHDEAIERRAPLARRTTAPPLDVEDRAGRRAAPVPVRGRAYVLDARRAFLADEQGLGKTVQALAALEADDAYPGGRRLPGEPEAQLGARGRALAAAPHGRSRLGHGGASPPADITIVNYDIVAAHRARLVAAAARGARARRVALLQEPAREAHAGGAPARRRRCRRTRCGSRSPARR